MPTYQEQTNKYAISNKIVTDTCICPECKSNQAVQKLWEQNDSGCINTYEHVTCTLCGFDSKDSTYSTSDEIDYYKYLNEFLNFEQLRENFIRSASPIYLTAIKCLLLKHYDKVAYFTNPINDIAVAIKIARYKHYLKNFHPLVSQI